jgi:hypothetical protein
MHHIYASWEESTSDANFFTASISCNSITNIIYVGLVPHRKLIVGKHNVKVRVVLTHQGSLLG